MTALVGRLQPAMTAAAHPYASNGRLFGVATRDIVQAAWVRLTEDDWRRLRSYDPERSKLETFVALVTRNIAQEMSRTLSGKAQHVGEEILSPLLDTNAPSPETRAADRERLLALADHLHEVLSPRNWLVFVLLFEDRLQPSEVAELIGVGRQTIFNISQTIRERALKFLQEQED